MTPRPEDRGSPRAVAAAARLVVARAVVALAVACALPVFASTAHAAPPPNDAASQAIEVAPIAAENGSTTDRQGVADLSEATPDAGTPRCLGPRSFQRTAWFRVPGGPLQRLRLDAVLAPGQPSEAAQIAAYVQPTAATTPSTTEPQACDGPETGSREAGVELAVPAGRDVLVQVGLPVGSRASLVLLSADADPLRQLAPPEGDDVSDERGIPFAAVRRIRLRGATLGELDPAQPACPASHTVWRKRKIRQTGQQVVQTRATDVATLTAFVGRLPAGDDVRGCVNARTSRTETLSVAFNARRGDTAWIRLGANELGPSSARTAFSGPCDQTPLEPLTRPRVRVGAPRGRARTARSVRLRLRTEGPCLQQARVTVTRGGAVVARGSYRKLVRGVRTLTLRRVARRGVPRGSYRVAVAGRTPTGRRATFGTRQTVRLR